MDLNCLFETHQIIGLINVEKREYY